MHSCALPLSFHARLILKSPSEDSRGYFCQQLADQIFGWGQHWDSGWWRGGGGWSWLPSWEGCQPLRGRDTSTFFAMHWSCSIAGEKRHNTYHSPPSPPPSPVSMNDWARALSGHHLLYNGRQPPYNDSWRNATIPSVRYSHLGTVHFEVHVCCDYYWGRSLFISEASVYGIQGSITGTGQYHKYWTVSVSRVEACVTG